MASHSPVYKPNNGDDGQFTPYKYGLPTAVERHRWMHAYSWWKKLAKPGETFSPPMDDFEIMAFMNDFVWAAANAAGPPTIDYYPRVNMNGNRMLLKRTMKKKMDDGRDNPNYGRWYWVNQPGDDRKFCWLTESMFWKSHMIRRCVADRDVLAQLEDSRHPDGGWHGVSLWDLGFMHLYTQRASSEELALMQLPNLD